MLHFTTQDLEGVAIFHCSGRIVAGNDTCLLSAIEANDARLVVLDLAEVRALDAAGLGTLAGLAGWARATGRRLKLLNVTPWIEALLRLTKLYGALEVCSVIEMLDLFCRAADPCVSNESRPQNRSHGACLHQAV